MDQICLPVQYLELTESDLQKHLRYCAGLPDAERAEFLLGEASVVIPVVKRHYQTKSAELEILIRSGSISRDHLAKIKEQLSASGFNLKTSLTSKRKMLKRIIVPLIANNGTVVVTSLKVFRIIATEIGLGYPCRMSVGYALGSESQILPERLVYRQPSRNAGYQFGLMLGRLIRKVVSLVTLPLVF